jgi:hypothetical protein
MRFPAASHKMRFPAASHIAGRSDQFIRKAALSSPKRAWEERRQARHRDTVLSRGDFREGVFCSSQMPVC